MIERLRRGRLPAELRPELARDERVVAWARVAGEPGAGRDAGGSGGGGRAVVATNWGLWLPLVAHRHGWHEVHRASWSGTTLTLTMATELARVGEPRGDGPGGDGPGGDGGVRYAVMVDAAPLAFRLVDPDRLPAQVRQRVNRSVAYTRHHQLPGGGSVRVVARRVSGVDGLRWTVRYEDGADPDAPGVTEATAELVDRAVSQTAAPVDGAVVTPPS
jgi:hypothetical protein